MAPQKPIKILMLHGYTQSGAAFRSKSKAVEKQLQKSLGGPGLVTLYYPTAPIRLKIADLPGERTAEELASAEDGDNWGWWRRNHVTGECIGLDETWVFLSKYMDEHGPFDGIIGFSQGAALASMLASLLEGNRSRPSLFTTAHPPLKFAVCYAGFKVSDDDLKSIYDPKLTTPILHFIGSLDTIIDEKRAIEIIECCEGDEKTKVVVTHPGGHYIPSGKRFLNSLIEFINEHMKPNDQGDGEGLEV
ncbi:Family of serine hydrolases 3 [Rhizina undulata]